MKISLCLVSFVMIFSFIGCSQEESDATLVSASVMTENNPQTQNDTEKANAFDASMQLGESDRIPKAEVEFLDKLKAVAKNGDSIDFKKLYFLEDANPEYVPMIDYIFNQKWATHFKDLNFTIEPNQKAKLKTIYFTVPYLGDVVVKPMSGEGTGTTKMPVGIKEGVYYLTIGSER